MKTLLLSCLITIAFAGELSATVSATQTQTKQAEDVSLMKPTDAAYSEALRFAAVLRQQGFEVTSIHRSKLEGFFQGLTKAAFFRIGKGVIEVIFLPDAKAARQIEVNTRREGERYVYSFRGQPQLRPTADTMNSAYPNYFITHGNAFIVTNDSELATALNTNFARLDKQ